jgi:hypothetical protein
LRVACGCCGYDGVVWVSSCSFPQIYSFHICVHVPIPLPPILCSRARECPFITSSSFLRTDLRFSYCLVLRYHRAGQPGRHIKTRSTQLLSRRLQPPNNLSHIGRARPRVLNIPATASGRIIIIHPSRTSPRLNVDVTCARDTAPRCARIVCGSAACREVRDGSRRRTAVLLARCGD